MCFSSSTPEVELQFDLGGRTRITTMLKILNIVGARPNFVKIAPLMEAMKMNRRVRPILVHTGQHYDQNLSDSFFADLKIPQPDYNLGIGSDSQTQQTAKIMMALEPICLKVKPDLILVVGDVNSTLAGALVASKLGIKLAHVEAGLRSGDRTMPEEINRIVVDHLSDFLFTSLPEGAINLKQEGINTKKIFFVGNVMIDSLEKLRVASCELRAWEKFSLLPKEYILVTMHRASNVDEKNPLLELLAALEKISLDLKIIWPIHPRTNAKLKEFGLDKQIAMIKSLILSEPLGYLEFLSLEMQARLVMTDSGGVQEETSYLGVPCLTLRDNTERWLTVKQGTNQLVKLQTGKILSAVKQVLAKPTLKPARFKYWDGRASQRIVRILINH